MDKSIIVKCKECDRPIKEGKVYCDRTCQLKYRAKKAEENSWSVCVNCGTTFQQGKYKYKGKEVYKKNLNCSPECVKQSYEIRRENNLDIFWSKEEEKLLIEWIQIKPVHLIYNDWNEVARINGWKKRSRHTIANKTNRLVKATPDLKHNYIAGRNQSAKRIHVTKDNWSLQDLKRILGIRRYGRVLRWAHKKGLEYQDVSSPQKKYYMVSRKALRKFARQHPEEFWGIERKNLAKVLPRKLANAIYKLNRERQPTNGRALPVICLDTGDVYRSGTAAAKAVGLSVSSVIDSAKSDKITHLGLDFFRFDYPTYWIPPDVKEEFNFTAGKVLYQLYLDICRVTGYQKQSCLIVAARLAVEITLYSFRKREKHWCLNLECEPVEVMAEYYRNLFIKKLAYIFNLESSYVVIKIINILKRRVYRYAFAACKGNKMLVEEYSTEFANFFIQDAIKQYYKNSYLPVKYHPIDKLQHADLWAYIYRLINVTISIGKEENGTRKTVYWVLLRWLRFQEKYKLNLSPQTTTFVSNWQKHNSVESNNDSEVDRLLETAKEIYDKNTYEQLSMFVALKLEEASDAEIIDAMEIDRVEIQKMLVQLANCA